MFAPRARCNSSKMNIFAWISNWGTQTVVGGRSSENQPTFLEDMLVDRIGYVEIK